jgi:hypothetical protein
MKTKVDLQFRVIGTLVAMTLLLQPAAAAGVLPDPGSGQQVEGRMQAAEAPPAPTPQNEAAAPAQPISDQLPDSPGALRSQANDGLPQQSDGQQAVHQPQPVQQNRPHEPVGTAAAEWVPTMGIAASRPAGAALAPAKQRRARTVLIKVGALLGAGVAVGTVMALSAGSPSKPPGSH